MESVHALDSGRASIEEDEENERRSSRDRERLNLARVPWQEGERQEEENLGILFETHGGLATTAVDALPTVNISEEHLNSDINSCAVCKEEFELGAETRQMPCEHLFHPHCILPWLTIRRSCPVCRSQLHSEDNDETSGNNPSSYSSGSDNEPQITQNDNINNDNGASSSSSVAPRGILTSSGTWLYRRRQTTQYVNNNNDNGASFSSSVAPKGTATISWNHPHID